MKNQQKQHRAARRYRTVSNRASRLTRTGGSLIEVMISVMIVGVVIAPAIGVFTRVAHNYYRQSINDRAHLLGRNMMAEISSLSFHDPDPTVRTLGPELDESTRADFDDIDDYIGIDEQPPLRQDGTVEPQSDDYQRIVNVEYIEKNNGIVQVSDSPTRLKLITVEVFGPEDVHVVFKTARFVRGVFESTPVVESSEIQKVDLSITSETTGSIESSGIEILNRFPN